MYRKLSQIKFFPIISPKKEVLHNWKYFFSNFRGLRKRVLNHLFLYANVLQRVYPTQGAIAAHLGCSREEVCRILKEFEELGLLESEYRHMTSKIYKISTWFFMPKIRKELAPIFSALKALPVAFLTQLYYIRYRVLKNINYMRQIFSFSQASTIEELMKDLDEIIIMKTKIRNPKEIIPYSIRNLPFLRLTKAGEIELSVFPDEAIRDTKNRYYQRKRHIRTPFKWFYKLCCNYVEREGLEKNFNRYFLLKEYYNLPKDSPMTKERKAKKNGYIPFPEKVQSNRGSKKRTSYEILQDMEQMHTTLRQKWRQLFGATKGDQFIDDIIANKYEPEYIEAVERENILKKEKGSQ